MDNKKQGFKKGENVIGIDHPTSIAEVGLRITVKLVPGMKAYDKKNYICAEEGFVGTDGVWRWQEDFAKE